MSDLCQGDLLALMRSLLASISKAKIREYQAKYRREHREEAAEYDREHHEEILARQREYNQRNPEKRRAYYRRNRKKIVAYYRRNLARIKARQGEYCREHREESRAYGREWHHKQAALTVAGQMRSLALQLQQRLEGRTMVVEANPNTVPGLLEALNTVAAMSDPDELRRSIVAHLNHLVLDFIQLAALVKRCNELGIGLSDMQIPILPYLMRLACGQIVPEVLVQFHSRPRHLRRIEPPTRLLALSILGPCHRVTGTGLL